MSWAEFDVHLLCIITRGTLQEQSLSSEGLNVFPLIEYQSYVDAILSVCAVKLILNYNVPTTLRVCVGAMTGRALEGTGL